jgi:hypothetical protein
MPTKTSRNIELEILDKYSSGYGTCELSRIFELNRWTVLQILKRNGITPERITRPYKNKYNINFFQSYNQSSTYWAGFIFADGNVHKKRMALQIALQKSDESHLKKFLTTIECSANVYIDKQTDSRKIQISGKWFGKQLENMYGIVPNKSLSIPFPEQVPDEYISHFLRGVFDGDGSVFKNRSGTVVINITGNSLFIPVVRSTFLQLLDDDNIAPIQYNKKNPKICSIHFSSTNAKIILDWLYQDSTNEIRLDRKHNRYIQYFGDC